MTAPPRVPSPWDDHPSLASLLATARAALVTPTQFFRALTLDGGAWAFVIAIGWPCAILGTLADRFVGPTFAAGPLGEWLGAIGWAEAILAPLILVVTVWLEAVTAHAALRMFGAGGGGYKATLRVFAYASAVALVAWIPVAGWLVALVWNASIVVVGLREIHGTTTRRVVLALTLPGIVVALVVAVLIVVAIAQIANSVPS